MIRNNQTYYYHADGLGSVVAITDQSGVVVQKYEYDSFGQIIYVQDSNFVQPYTYTGREYDSESGLYYYRSRYYDAKVGRFITQDPILSPMNPMSVTLNPSHNKIVWLLPYFKDNPTTLHPYLYANSNPLRYIDPFGLQSEGCDECDEYEGINKGKLLVNFLSTLEGMQTIGVGIAVVGGTAYLTKSPILTGVMGGMMIPVFGAGAYKTYHGIEGISEELRKYIKCAN